MSERVARRTGIILLLAAILISLLPLLMTRQYNGRKYHSADSQEWMLKEIVTEKNGTLRINTANPEELEILPGIGKTYAERIVSEKLSNGPFYYPEDLEAVNGIGTQTLSGFRTMIDMTLDESGY